MPTLSGVIELSLPPALAARQPVVLFLNPCSGARRYGVLQAHRVSLCRIRLVMLSGPLRMVAIDERPDLSQ